jgi:hypothetical protein
MDLSEKRSEKRWYRKAQVAARYAVSGRTIERAVDDGRLPPPKYPLGAKFPYWDGDELDEHDRNLAARTPQRANDQPKSEVVQATTPTMPKRGRGRSRRPSEAAASEVAS